MLWLIRLFCEQYVDSKSIQDQAVPYGPHQLDLPSNQDQVKKTKISHIKAYKYTEEFHQNECETRALIGLSSAFVLLFTIFVIVLVKGCKANKWVKVQLFLVFLSNLFGLIFSFSLNDPEDTIYQDPKTFLLQMVKILTYLSTGMLSTWHFVY